MAAVWTITRKDLLLRLRDRSVLLYGMVAPLALAVVLGGIFGGVETAVELDLVVVEDEGRALAGPFVDDVLPALQADGLVTGVEVVADRATARRLVEEEGRTAAIVFDDAAVDLLGDVDSPTGVGVTEAVVGAYLDRVADVTAAVDAAVASGAVPPAAVVAAAPSVDPALVLVDEPVGIVLVDLRTYLAGGMAVFFLLFAVGLAVTGLLEEERDGTWTRLATAPIPGWAPLASKALTALVVGVTSMAALVVTTTLLVGADWGDPVGVALLVVTAVAAATGVVALVASFTSTPESANGALGVVGTVLGALGGAFFPLRAVGGLDLLAAATPHHWFLRGVTRLAGGGSVGDVVPSLVALTLFAVVAGWLAVRRTVRRLEV